MNRSVRRGSSVDYYSAEAGRFAAQYDSVAFDAVHLDLLADLPPPGAAVLDVGSGSGRDALALARRGYRVTAVEPARALREHAQAADLLRHVRWLDDRLPNLRRVRSEGARFDFILCSAVLMHLAPGELGSGLAGLARLLTLGGVLAISLRDPSPDDPPTLFHAHASEHLMRVAYHAGFAIKRRAEPADALGRRGIQWRTFTLERVRPAAPSDATGTSA